MAASIADHPDVRSALELFTAWIEYRLAYWAIPSLAVAIVHDQEVVWASAFGFTDVERKLPVTPETIYGIGSVTKLFTATAIMQLRDAGVIRLDDPIVAHLPWFTINRDPEHCADELTILHLLTHTSGLPRESAFPYWSDFQFPSVEEMRDALGRQSTVLAADSRWKYSNLGFALAGEIIAAVSGVPYSEYITKRILAPLEMNDTFVQPPSPDHPRLAQGYGRRYTQQQPRSPRPVSDLQALAPAGNISSTVLDLARFAMLHFRTGPAEGSQVLAGSTLREMHRVHWLDPDWKAGWGLGFRIQREDGRTCVGHGGLIPGYSAQLRLIPDEKVAIIVLANAEDVWPFFYVQSATKAIVPAIAAARRKTEPAETIDPAWGRYVGRYRNPWGDCQVMLGKTHLQIIHPLGLDPTRGIVTLRPVAEHTFRMATRDGYGSHG